MPKVLPEYLQLRKEQILDAAAACFARRGFHQTTMQDICEEAELSPGALYRYFRSKEELIEDMCARGQNTGLIAGAMANDDTLAVIDALTEAFFGSFADESRNPAICALNVEVISEAPRSERIREILASRNQEIRSLLREVIVGGQARREIDPSLDAEAVAVAMVALYQGFVTQKLVEPGIDIGAYAAVIRAFFHGTFWAGNISTAKPAAAPILLRH